MMKYIFPALILIFIGCKEKKSEDVCIEDPLVVTSLGLQNDHNAKGFDSAALAIEELNNSDVTAILKIIARAKIDTSTYDQFTVIKPVSDRNNILNYLIFRYLDYIGDVNKNTLISILLSRSPYSARDQCMKDIVHKWESNYFSYFTYTSQESRDICLDSLKSTLRQHPTSLRVKYLLADLEFRLGKFDESILLFNELANANYYRYNSLRKIVEYNWRSNKSDSFIYYVRQIQGLYPLNCIPELVDSFSVSKNLLGALSEYHKCLSHGTQRDSIKATVYLSKCYLNTNYFAKVDSIYSQFDKTNGYILDSLKIWVTGEFYDLKLRSLFLQKKYKKCLEFAMRNVGANEKIKVDNATELYKLVKKYYMEYYPGRTDDEYNIFFNKEFFRYDEAKKSI